MVKFTASTMHDLPQIQEWIIADPYHRVQGQPEWWLTGNGLLAFCMSDEQGPLTYVRMDDEGEYVRIHIQFAPVEEVSKARLVAGLLQGLPKFTSLYKDKGKKGFVFESVSPSLIRFMNKCNFQSVGGNDYRLDFEVTNVRT